MELAGAFFEEHSDLYMSKSKELLTMFYGFDNFENYSQTIH
jgi:hypothetical protein